MSSSPDDEDSGNEISLKNSDDDNYDISLSSEATKSKDPLLMNRKICHGDNHSVSTTGKAKVLSPNSVILREKSSIPISPLVVEN